ncbi:MBL fold metallo-hydrolase [Pseudorhodoferax sp. Leaf265]|jgi:phosphoribosyl 1,2-cyclic phosphodiesterase|uniref:MBL fold metallo-hydrolase n=1 Tax=Pseudorhodoferax sp. Leaf265 TaxID=1736315 RepID=UPI0006F9152C|nr:MBL fold metallo-hydrolase [Pseudorhodoferax sp. Leaf265]KQP21017.1 MBL fold metallo-hydrolase [Pseudorhodoferax sp. Leaf265]PZP94052.1 MAG: MBL fold metallo-hydrolase [Variovorax paradoxus]PZQ04623.1 MAG: MBL fold metallo-hydrolase [Variovorax paradoxus]
MLRFRNLGSGSTGNATVVEAHDGGRPNRLLIDCGLGPRTLATRLGLAGLDMADIDAIFVTHEHSDHIGSACKIALRHRIPLWMSHGTHQAIGAPDLGELLHIARDGDAVGLGALQFRPFTVPHDAREPLQLRLSDGANCLGVLTDLGHATEHVLAQLAGCRAMLLECNHDPELLAASSYPYFLKRRVGGTHGHLANPLAAGIATALAAQGLQQIVAAHLSRQNNRPDLALAALAGAEGCGGLALGVADPVTGTDWIQV